MDFNYKQNWGSLAWQWVLAVGIQFAIVKVLGGFVGQFITDDMIANATAVHPGSLMTGLPFLQGISHLETDVLAFIRSDVFLGFWVGLGVSYFALKLDKHDEFRHAVIYSFVITGLFELGAFATQGFKVDLVGPLFFLECAPAWALIGDMFSGWVTGSVADPKPSGISYNDVGDFQRGARLADSASSGKVAQLYTAKETPEGGKAGIRVWNDHPFPFRRENQHFLIVGSPGAGKTQIIYPMIDQVYKRGDKAIIWDIKGTFIQAYAGQPGVDLLAAWDKRSVNWSPGADIRSDLDCQQVAGIIFPPNPRDSQPFFLNSARQILETIFMYLDSQNKVWGWGDVWTIISQDRKDIAKLLSSFEDGKALANVLGADTKSAEDVYSTLVGHAQQTIRWYAKAWPKGNVSLRKWVHSDSKLLIIGGIPERTDIAQATANMAVEIITNEVLSLPDNLDRRIWLFLDELATLGKLTSLLNAFSLGRSKGLCVVAGIQDVGKLEHHYGVTLAKSITNTFSTMMILRCTDNDTAQWASKALGEQDVVITQKSSSSGSSDGKSSSSTSESEVHKTRPVFMASEISNFPNLTGVLKVSNWPLIVVRWLYKAIPQDLPLVDEADWLKKKEKPAAAEKPKIKEVDPPRYSKIPEPPEEPTTASPFRLD